MANYIKDITISFQDESGTNLNKFKMTYVEDGVEKDITLARNATITAQGTPLNKTFFNNLATAINDNFSALDEETTDLANKVQEILNNQNSANSMLGKIKTGKIFHVSSSSSYFYGFPLLENATNKVIDVSSIYIDGLEEGLDYRINEYNAVTGYCDIWFFNISYPIDIYIHFTCNVIQLIEEAGGFKTYA